MPAVVLVIAGVLYLAAVAAGYITANRVYVVLVVLMLLFSGGQVFVSTRVLDHHGRPASTWSEWTSGVHSGLPDPRQPTPAKFVEPATPGTRKSAYDANVAVDTAPTTRREAIQTGTTTRVTPSDGRASRARD